MYSMLDSNLEINPRKGKLVNLEALKKMNKKFQLNKSRLEAEEFFKSIIEDSLNAMLTLVWDKVHSFKKWF